MFICKYSRKSISGDYIRAVIGLVITGGLLLAATKITIFQYILPLVLCFSLDFYFELFSDNFQVLW